MTAGLWLKALGGLLFLELMLGLMLFVSAGTLDYWQGWVFLAIFFVCTGAITLNLAWSDPALLQRRVDAGPTAERRSRQKVIQALAQLAFMAIVVVPGLDRRWGWSREPLAAVLAGDGLVMLGLFAVFRVFRANSFTSATIEVGQNQSLVDTGPYARVRHPMYTGALVMLVGMPLALGSWWALIAFVPMVLVIVVRLVDEERFLSTALEGYPAYCRRVRWRLVPGIY